MMCNCIEQMNRVLIYRNSTLDLSIDLFGRRPTMVQVSTHQTDKPNKKGVHVLAAYCPFCGQKYEADDQPAASE